MKSVPGEFSRRVWILAMSIPKGRVTTYGILTKAAGGTSPALARSITSILSRAPNPEAIPFHRIVYSGGKVWMDEKLHSQRMKYYQHEGIKVDKQGKIENFEDILYTFGE